MDPVTVLVVDDEHNVRDSVESILGSDYAVMRVDNGDAAVAIIYEESDQIELLILDLGLPGMSGYEALAEMQIVGPNVVVIVITGLDPDHELLPGVCGLLTN